LSKVTFAFDITARPNYILVGLMTVAPGVQRLLVLNGVHHVLALLQADREAAYAVIQPLVPGELPLNLGDLLTLKPNRLALPRPALVRDFLDDQLAQEVERRAVDQFAQVGIQINHGIIPRTAWSERDMAIGVDPAAGGPLGRS
jgi:hypothetical protein